MYDLINIFETFLPQLLLYPNPTDPLNGDAARLMLKDNDKYNDKVKEYVKFYAAENLTFKTQKIIEKKDEEKSEEKIEKKEKLEKEEEDEVLSGASELSNASIGSINDDE